MIRYEGSARIDRPPDEVFARLADVEAMDEWTDMTDSRWVGDRRAGVGARARAEMHIGPFRRPLVWEITEYEPGRRVAFRTAPGGAMDWASEYVLDPDDEGTLVRTAGEVRLHGVLRLLEPLIRLELPRGESRELLRLKAILERQPTAAATA